MRKSYNEIRFRKLVNDFGDATFVSALSITDSEKRICTEEMKKAKARLINFMDRKMQYIEKLLKDRD